MCSVRALTEAVAPLRQTILGETPPMDEVRRRIESVARFPHVAVLITGETGTGKELVARGIHDTACGPGVPFVAINCAAIPENLFESELFGHQSGSFTGAKGARPGLLEVARGGTVFLDEVGEMPLSIQPKLLRVLEARTFRRVGSNANVTLDARVISATNARMDSTRLRPDLYYRLCGFHIATPPLRERLGDLPALARRFLDEFAVRSRLPPLRLDPGALEELSRHDWPGNVRELRAVVEHMAITATGADVGAAEARAAIFRHPQSGTIRISREMVALPNPTPEAPAGRPWRDVQRELILEAFRKSDGNVSRAARELQIPRSTFRDLLRRCQVAEDDPDTKLEAG